MSPVEAVREFVSRRLSAAAGEIFSVFLPTLVQYQEKIQTQQRLLQTSRRETTKSQRTDKLQHFHREYLPHSILNQEETEPPQIKEELLGVDQFADTVMVTVVDGESDSRENLDSHNSVREFINQRLTAAAGEIYTEFQQTIIQYQEEIQTQERLLEFNLIPQMNLHGIDCPQQQINISLDLKEPDSLQIKEEQQEKESIQIKEEEAKFHRSHVQEQIVLKHEDDFMNPTHEQSQPIEPDSELLLFQNSVVTGGRYRKNVHLVDADLIPKEGQRSQKSLDGTNVENFLFTQSSLTSSRELHTDTEPHSCEICGKKYRWSSQMMVHMRTHTGEKPHSCLTCGKGFHRKGSLCRHNAIHSGEKPHSCEQCDKSFTEKANLLAHMRIHSREKPHTCVTCAKSFTQRADLLRHITTHTGEKPHSCTLCGKSFRQKSHLLGHMRIHSGEKPYSCEQCGKSFSNKSKLLGHMKIHSGVKPYPCEQCGKCFSEKGNLLAHMRIHSGEKPHSCVTCGKSFRRKSHLLRHNGTHSGEQPHSTIFRQEAQELISRNSGSIAEACFSDH